MGGYKQEKEGCKSKIIKRKNKDRKKKDKKSKRENIVNNPVNLYC